MISRKKIRRVITFVLTVIFLLPGSIVQAEALVKHYRLDPWSAVNHLCSVPAGTSLLAAQITAGQGTLDLYLKKGAMVSGATPSAIRESADFYSEGEGWKKVVAVNPGSSPAVCSGDWYLAVVNMTDQAATYTLEIFLENSENSVSKLFFPYVIEYQNWHSEISLLNGDDRETIRGTLVAYDQSGVALAGNSREVILAPNARLDLHVATAFPDPGSIYYLVFESAAAAMVKGYARIYVDGLYRACLPATTKTSAGDLNISHIASDSQWSTEISLLNTSSESRDVTLTFNTGQQVTRSLEPASFDSFTISRLFGGQPQPAIQSARISGAAGVIGVELFANNGLRIMDGLLLDDAVVTELYFPHTAIDGGWATGVAIYNPNAESCDLTLTPFDIAGNSLGRFYATIDQQEKYIGNIASLGFPAAAAWVRIEASEPVYGFELFMKYNQMGGYAAVNLSGRQGYFAKVGDGDVTGIAFINQDETSAAIQLTAYAADGTVVAGQELELSPGQKNVAVAEEFFDDDLTGVTHIRFAADRQVVGFELNFSPDGTMLDGLGAVLLPETAELAGAGIVDLAARALTAGNQNAFVDLLSAGSRSLVEALGSDFSLTSANGAVAANELASALRRAVICHSNREMVDYETTLQGETFAFQVVFDGDAGEWRLGGL